MTQITFVLPFGLPPPELAPDLVRALQAPALAELLTRSSCRDLPVDESLRVLPHEAWLARTLGLSTEGQPAFAAAAMRGLGLDPGSDSWFIINPAHVEITRSHLSIADTRRLQLEDGHSRALFDTARPVFDAIGKTLVYGDAHTWFMRAGEWTALSTASPDSALGLNLNDWLPSGAPATEFRKLQNEVQMLWFEHDANVARESRGLAPVNSFWPWGQSAHGSAVRAEPLLAVRKAPGWLSAMANCPAPSLPNPFSGPSPDSILVCGELSEPAVAADWAEWLTRMQRFEETLFAPTLAEMKKGRSATLTLVLSHRGAIKEFTTTKWAQRAFWRSPALDRLLT